MLKFTNCVFTVLNAGISKNNLLEKKVQKSAMNVVAHSFIQSSQSAN
jgi:hypothetical protein